MAVRLVNAGSMDVETNRHTNTKLSACRPLVRLMVRRNRDAPAAFVLPLWARLALYSLTVFVAYSQFVSVALTGMYRYDPMEPSFSDGASPEMYAGLTVWEPSWTVSTIASFADWYMPYRPVRDAVVGIGLAILGSGGFLLCARLRRSWRFSSLIVLGGSAIGNAAALFIKAYEWGFGSTWLSSHSIRSTGGPLSRHVIHPIYGEIELAGSLAVPIIAHTASALAAIGVIFWIVGRRVARWTRAAR